MNSEVLRIWLGAKLSESMFDRLNKYEAAKNNWRPHEPAISRGAFGLIYAVVTLDEALDIVLEAVIQSKIRRSNDRPRVYFSG